MNIGERIYDLRKRNNMTQEKLAELLCVSPQAISKWERGVANPDLYLIPNIASLFNVSADLLLGMDTSDTEGRLERLEKQLETLTSERRSPAEPKSRENKKVACFDFKRMSEDEKKKWKTSCAEIIDLRESVVFKAKSVERIVRSSVDPQLMISNIEVDLTDVRNVVVRLRTLGNTRNHTLQVFYVTKENPVWDELKSFRQSYPNGNMIDVVIPCFDMGNINIGKITVQNSWKLSMRSSKDPIGVMMELSDTLFRGTLTGLRIDPIADGVGYCEIESVMLVKSSGEVPLCFDFKKKSDRESDKCRLYNAERRESDTCYAFDVHPVGIKGSVFDPQLIREGLALDISRARQVHVRIRGELANKHKRGWHNNNAFFNANLQVFFTTESSPHWSPQKCATCSYVVGEGWFDLYLDMSKNIHWNGILTGIRIDPENEDGIFEVELVEIVEATEKSGAQPSSGSLRELEAKIEELESRLEELHCLYEELYSQYEDLEGDLEDLEEKLDGED